MPATTRHSCACLHQGDNCGPIFHLSVEKAESARFFGSCSGQPFAVYHSSLKVFMDGHLAKKTLLPFTTGVRVDKKRWQPYENVFTG